MSESAETSRSEPQAQGAPVRLGLALSGGGFRASLFHIGVLARLAELDLLRQVEVLSCVSGGSIIGALYYLYLKRELDAHGDIPSERLIELVDEMERHFLSVIQTNLRWQTFSNLRANLEMARADYSRTDRLGDVLDERLYRPVWNGDRTRPIEMRELRIHPGGDPSFHPATGNAGRRAKVPMLMINATALNSGHNWRFEAARMGEPEPSALERQLEKNILLQQAPYGCMIERQKTMPLGQAVGASACVPGIFEPFPISDLYPNPLDGMFSPDRLRVQLVDGGVHDNLGLEALRERGCTHYVISDASGQMLDQAEPETWLGAVIGRSSSILMDRVRELQLARLFDANPGRVAVMHLRHDLAPLSVRPLAEGEGSAPGKRPARGCTGYRVDQEAQRLLAEVRTDLDSFTDVEAFALMADGYRMTSWAFECLRMPSQWPSFDPSAVCRLWRFTGLLEKLEKPDAALTRQLEIACDRLFKLPKLDHRVQYAVKASAALLILGIVVGLTELYQGMEETEWSFEQFPYDKALFWLLVAIGVYPAYLGLRYASRKSKGLRWLMRPVGWIAAAGQICLAPFLWLLAQSQLRLFNGLFLAQGKLETIGLSSAAAGLSPSSAPAATAPAGGGRSERAA
jgi:NTE family protein